MPNIYCDLAVGADTNNGSINAPVKNLYRALWQATSGDTVIVSGTTPGAPHRCTHVPPAGVTIRASDPQERFHVSALQNVSQGAVYEMTGLRAHFKTGATTGSPRAWNGTSSTNVIDPADSVWGAGSAVLTNGQFIRPSSFFLKGRKVRLRVVYKCAAGARLQGAVQQDYTGTDPRSGSFAPVVGSARYAFNFATGLWDDYGAYDLVDTNGALLNSQVWAEAVTPWCEAPDSLADWAAGTSGTAGSTGNNINLTASGTVHIQSIVVEAEANWASVATDVYRLMFSGDSGTWADWLASASGRNEGPLASLNVTGLYYATDLADYTTYRISEGLSSGGLLPEAALQSYSQKTTTERIDFKVEPGRAITDYVLLMASGRDGWTLTDTTGGITIIDCDVIGSQIGYNVNPASGTPVYRLERCRSFVSLMYAFATTTPQTTGTALPDAKYLNCEAYEPIFSPFRKAYGGGFMAGISGDADALVLHCEGCYSLYAGDDAFQPIGGAHMNLYGCAAYAAMGNGIELSPTAGTGHVYNIKGFTAVGCADQGIRDESGIPVGGNTGVAVTINAHDWVLLGNGLPPNNPVDLTFTNVPGGGRTWNKTGVIIAENLDLSGFAGFSGNDNTISLAEALLTLPGLSPQEGSPLIGIGTKWWGTAARPASANGEPYPDIDLDAGGCQSMHGQMHPVNV